jgi:hypothetical protein
VLKHRRAIDVQVYERGDGLWEVDATVTDTKSHDLQMAQGPRPAGVPIHELHLRLVVNTKLDVLQAGSHSEWMPYAGHCGEHGDVYARLVGLNLMQDFRRSVAALAGGVRGCTHLTELAQVLPTAVIQAFAGQVIDTRGQSPTAAQPFQIDRCHALRSDGEAVRAHYPRWYRQPGAKEASHNPPDAALRTTAPSAE